ncbi:MAG: radical SAM family heme chaperone HemW [Chloroflexi bacterium]|nr:radical SAM family heme chaperone HemW [Chloroflexota bacterium]
MHYSLYFHIPFCVHRCAYCDFNTYAGQEALIPAYVDALCNEIRCVAGSAPQRLTVHTIFFGGGTPSLLSQKQFESILKAARDSFDLAPDAEISLEANPGTVTLDSLRDLRGLGFNRFSLGVQSAYPDELRQLERIHDYFDVIEAVTWARRAGFDNLNLDLIFGLPEQSLDRWQATVKLILGLRPDHLSLYALTVEHGTPFGRWAQRGLLSVPDPDAAADMYEWAGEALEAAGFEQYEISNWAKPGRQCRHNLQYWRGQPYLGFGAGAHGCASGLRISNVLRIKTYIERLRPDYPIPNNLIPNTPFPLSPATANQTKISMRVEMQETMLTGLRLTREGVSAEDFADRFGVQIRDVFGRGIDELIDLLLLEWAGPVLRLTKRGRLLGNQVFMRFVD